MLPMNTVDIFINAGDPCICPVNHLFCDRNHENGPCPVRSLGVAENAYVHVRNAHEEAASRPSRCADDTTQWGVTRDDYSRNHFNRRPVDRRLCESEVAMRIGLSPRLPHGESRW